MEVKPSSSLAMACLIPANRHRRFDGGFDRVVDPRIPLGRIGGLGLCIGGDPFCGFHQGFEQTNATNSAKSCFDGFVFLGVGQDHLDRSIALGGAKSDFEFKLARPGGRLCGDDQGVLAGHGAGLHAAEVETDSFLN